MKYLIPCMLCMLLFFACKKNNQENTAPPNGSSAVLDSSYFYSTGPKEIVLVSTKFQYDAQGRFTGTNATMTDSTVDHHLGATPDTSSMVLTYSGADTRRQLISIRNSRTITLRVLRVWPCWPTTIRAGLSWIRR